MAYALNFNDKYGGNLFKVFLGRDDLGEIYSDQKIRFDVLIDSSKLIEAQINEK